MDIENPNNFRLKLTIKSPEQIFFEGDVDAISSLNERGPFDVLPLHTNFISIVKDVLVIYQNKKKLKEMKIDRGVLHVLNNTVQIYLGI